MAPAQEAHLAHFPKLPTGPVFACVVKHGPDDSQWEKSKDSTPPPHRLIDRRQNVTHLGMVHRVFPQQVILLGADISKVSSTK